MIVAEEASEEQQQFSADDFVAVHVADVLEFRLSWLVDGWVVADGQNPQVST